MVRRMAEDRKPGQARVSSVLSIEWHSPGRGHTRLRWIDVHDNEQKLPAIPNAKAGATISSCPIPEEIAGTLRMARDAAKEGAELVFPGLSYIDYRDAGLPVKGQALRHTYRTICADLEIDELITHYLMGHAPQGISQKYIATLILQNGPAMRAAQNKISARDVRVARALTFAKSRDRTGAIFYFFWKASTREPSGSWTI